MIRDHIDTHTLAEDQTIEGLFGQSPREPTPAERAWKSFDKHMADFGRGPDRTAVTVSAPLMTPEEQRAAATRILQDARQRNWKPPQPTGASTMDTKSITKTLATDATEAAWRTAGSQFVKLAREPLVGLLQRHLAPGDDAFRARLAAFLETELGTALLASMLSASLSAMPQTAGDVPTRLARELRVRAMADAGDVLADVLMGPLRQVMALYLQDAQDVRPPALGDGAEAAAGNPLRVTTQASVPR